MWTIIIMDALLMGNSVNVCTSYSVVYQAVYDVSSWACGVRTYVCFYKKHMICELTPR